MSEPTKADQWVDKKITSLGILSERERDLALAAFAAGQAETEASDPMAARLYERLQARYAACRRCLSGPSVCRCSYCEDDRGVLIAYEEERDERTNES
jgi:hypothetical protein